MSMDVRDQCKALGSALKQIGGPARDKKDQMEDFPDDLRIRDFPEDDPQCPNSGKYPLQALLR